MKEILSLIFIAALPHCCKLGPRLLSRYEYLMRHDSFAAFSQLFFCRTQEFRLIFMQLARGVLAFLQITRIITHSGKYCSDSKKRSFTRISCSNVYTETSRGDRKKSSPGMPNGAFLLSRLKLLKSHFLALRAEICLWTNIFTHFYLVG